MTYCIFLRTGSPTPLKCGTSHIIYCSFQFLFVFFLTSSFLTSRAGCLDFSILTFRKWPHSIAVVLNTISTLRLPHLAAPTLTSSNFQVCKSNCFVYISSWMLKRHLEFRKVKSWLIPPQSQFLILSSLFLTTHIQSISKYF